MSKEKDNILAIRKMLKKKGIVFEEDGRTISITFSDENERIAQKITAHRSSLMFTTTAFRQVGAEVFGETSEKLMRLSSRTIQGIYLIDPGTREISFKTSSYSSKGPIGKKDAFFHVMYGFYMIRKMDEKLESSNIPAIGIAGKTLEPSFYS